MDKYRCNICLENVGDDPESDCPSIAHLVEVDETPLEEIQQRKFGVYVDPETGKIVKAKALNNPLILG